MNRFENEDLLILIFNLNVYLIYEQVSFRDIKSTVLVLGRI